MPHPEGGKGTWFEPKHSFIEAYNHVGPKGLSFISTTGESITAKHGLAQDGTIQTIVFIGSNSRVGNVCVACWGFRESCSGTRIGQCAEALDKQVPTRR